MTGLQACHPATSTIQVKRRQRKKHPLSQCRMTPAQCSPTCHKQCNIQEQDKGCVPHATCGWVITTCIYPPVIACCCCCCLCSSQHCQTTAGQAVSGQSTSCNTARLYTLNPKRSDSTASLPGGGRLVVRCDSAPRTDAWTPPEPDSSQLPPAGRS